MQATHVPHANAAIVAERESRINSFNMIGQPSG
jgi:hypothetical protein